MRRSVFCNCSDILVESVLNFDTRALSGRNAYGFHVTALEAIWLLAGKTVKEALGILGKLVGAK